MSARQKSSINSPLFMEDPITPNKREIESSGDSDKNEDIIKIEEDKEQFLNVNSPTSSFQVNRASLKEILSKLKEKSKNPITSLDAESKESLRNVMGALKLLYSSPALYDMILKDIKEIFKDDETVIPGTVAAFFIGCSTNSNFNGPRSCNPTCASSLPPTSGTPDFKQCENMVLIHSDGLFSSLNEYQSELAYIYITSQEFKGFTHDNLEQLLDVGVLKAVLIFGDKDGSYKEITKELEIGSLPIDEESSNDQDDEDTTTDSDTNYGWIILIIVIVLIFLLLGGLLYNKYK